MSGLQFSLNSCDFSLTVENLPFRRFPHCVDYITESYWFRFACTEETDVSKPLCHLFLSWKFLLTDSPQSNHVLLALSQCLSSLSQFMLWRKCSTWTADVIPSLIFMLIWRAAADFCHQISFPWEAFQYIYTFRIVGMHKSPSCLRSCHSQWSFLPAYRV